MPQRQVVPEVRDRGLMYRIRETMANAYQSIAIRGKAANGTVAPASGQAAQAASTAPALSAPPVAAAATRRKSLVKVCACTYEVNWTRLLRTTDL